MADLAIRVGNLEKKPARRVRAALVEGGYGDRVVELSETARSAQEAAASLGVKPGAIVKSLVFVVGGTPVMVLVAGDRSCRTEALPSAFNLEGKAKRPGADTVKQITGFSIGGVAPIGGKQMLPTIIDRSFERFETVYAAAGHPHCVFPVRVADLEDLTGGTVSDTITAPIGDGARN